MNKNIILILRLVVAVILIQTLRYKFTAHPDSVYIFETVGLEPFGRIGVGILELIAAILLLFGRTVWLGALMSAGMMAGAIGLHINKLGVEIQNDGGILFYMAMGVFIFSIVILFNYRKNIPIIGSKF
ncbi:DoxX family membrane protein [Urechidicola sp. KH5]